LELLRRLFGRKPDESEKAEISGKITEIDDEEEIRWREEIKALEQRDPELYDIAIHLHLDPIGSISQKLKVFTGDKDVDVLSIDPEIVAKEADDSFQRMEYNRAVIGYICAIDVVLLQAAVNASKGNDEKLRAEYIDEIVEYSSGLREIEEEKIPIGQGRVVWSGLIGTYSNVGKRARETLDIATRVYGNRLKSHGEKVTGVEQKEVIGPH